MSETFECPTCGYRWQQGQHGGHSCSDRLLQQLKDAQIELNSVLVDWNAIVSASGSKTHGGAVGHVAQMRAELEAVKAEREELKNELGGWEATIRSYVPEKYNANETALCAVENYISDLNHDLDSLRAHIEAAEKQEPCAEITMSCGQFPHKFAFFYNIKSMDIGAKLYALPPMPAQQPLKYTNDGALAECPCCGSLDVGGAHDTVHCYKCGLTIKKPPPLKNACDAWNKRAYANAKRLPMVERNLMRNLVDRVWMHVTESENVPSTKTADELIDLLLSEYSHHCNLKTISDIQAERDSLRARIEAAEKQEPFACYVGEGFLKYPAMNIASIKKAAKKFGYEFAELYKLPPMPAQQPNWKAEAKRAFWAGLEMGAAFGACAIPPKWEEYIAKRESEMAQSNDFESGSGE